MLFHVLLFIEHFKNTIKHNPDYFWNSSDFVLIFIFFFTNPVYQFFLLSQNIILFSSSIHRLTLRTMSQKTAVDTIITAGYVIPVVPKKTVLANTSVVIKDGVIVDILPNDVWLTLLLQLPTLSFSASVGGFWEIRSERSLWSQVPCYCPWFRQHSHSPRYVPSPWLLWRQGAQRLAQYSNLLVIDIYSPLDDDIWPAEGKFISTEFIKDVWDAVSPSIL